MDQDQHDTLLKIRRDAMYLKTENGIFFRSPFGDFTLKGKTIFDSFNSLFPYLDGSWSKRALCESLSDDNRAAATSLLDLLVERKVIYQIDPADRRLIDPAVASCFRSQIDYLNHFTDTPGRRFHTFRTARILLMGEGAALVGAGLALLSNGIEKLTVASSDPVDHDDPLWSLTQTALAEKGADSEVISQDFRSVSPAEYDLVIYCSAAPDLKLLSQLACDRQVRLLPAFRLGDRSYIGPSSSRDKAGCWLCAMMRRSKRVSPDLARDFWVEMIVGQYATTPVPMSSVAAQMLGNSVALEAYKLLVDSAGPETNGQLLEQNLTTLETAIRQFLPEPTCPRCRSIEPVPSTAPPLEAAATVARWTPYMGHDFASHDAFDDEAIDQLPINISSLPSRKDTIYGTSLRNALQARVHALGEAIRRDVIAGDAHYLSRKHSLTPAVADRRIGNWLGVSAAKTGGSGVDGVRLDNAGSVSIPLGALHPSLDRGGRFDAAQAGLGAALTREDATEQAAFDLFEHLVIEALADGILPLWSWSETSMETDETTRHLMSIIRGFGVAAPAIAVTEHYGSAVAIIMPIDGEVPLAGKLNVACGLNVHHALHRLLERFVARLQVTQGGAKWPEVPRRGAFMTLPLVLPQLEGTPAFSGPPTIDICALAARLAAEGTMLVAVDLTPPDVQACGGYIIIKALFVRAARGA